MKQTPSTLPSPDALPPEPKHADTPTPSIVGASPPSRLHTKSLKRTSYLKIRLTLMEKRAIEQKAAHAGMQTAPFCRSAALRRKITFKLTAEELANYQMLVKYHNNFKSIANLVKKRDPGLAAEVAATAAEILEHLKKFR